MSKPEELDAKSQDAVSDIVKNQQGEKASVTKLPNKDDAPKRLIGKDFDSKMVELLKKGKADLDEIKADRAELSTRKAAVIATWAAKGLSPTAIIDAATYCEKTDKEKLNYDTSYAFSREVFGDPIQIDLFEASVQAEIREKQS
jgi:hypothetical protein